MRLIGRLRLSASLPILALVAAGAPAAAQVAADPAPAGIEGEETAEDIVVTGSRIRRLDFDTPNPVVSLGEATIRQSGQTNLTDFLTEYPALQGSSTSADNSGDRAAIGATGLNLLDLRNLGTERTLVLVDGRRHVASLPGTQAVDINTIPSELVSRVDVLTGGVSAIYGADGVSGVVNFVMKQDFDGLAASGQVGVSRHGDGGQRQFSVTAGRNFAEGRANFAINYQYASESRLEVRDRPFLSGSDRIGFFLNPDDPENQGGYTGGNDNGIPDYVPLRDIRYFDTSRYGGVDLTFDGFPDFFVGPNGNVVAYDGGRFVPDFYQQGGNGTLVSDYGNDLLPEIERHIVNALGHFDVAPGLTLFAEGKYANVRSYSLGQPSFDYYLRIRDDNPFIPAAIRAEYDALNAAGACDRPRSPSFQKCRMVINRDNFDLGQRGEDIERETYRAVVGARGDITGNARYELSYTFGRTDITNRYVNDILDDRFYAAIDAVDEGRFRTGVANGNIVCRASLLADYFPRQPFNYTRESYAPTTFAPGECVPLNLFGENIASQAALDFVRVNTTDRARIEQHVVSGSIAGDTGAIFSLPGGAVGFALGGEYRREISSFTPDALAAQGLTFTNALAADRGRFDVWEQFAELNVPILKDLPFAHRLGVGAAIRFSDYSTIGSTTTWKVDGSWAPVRDITFTGTYSRAVRAPNIGELFGGRSQTFEFITDPCNVNQIQNGTQFRAANCQALLGSLGVADPTQYRDFRSSNISGFSGGNGNLREEEAETWTAGVILQPRFLPGLNLRADWYNIDLEGAINQVEAEQLAQLCVDQATIQNVFCDAITRQSGTAGTADAGNIVSFLVTPQNVARFRTAGLDVNLNYVMRTGQAGTFTLNIVGNYLDRLEFIGTPGAPTTNERGETRAPKYTLTGDITWKLGQVTLNYGLQWFDKTLRFTNLEVAGNPDIVADEYRYLKERWQHDIYASVDVTDRLQLYVGANNLFDQKPDIGTSIYPVDSLGRYMYAGFRVSTGR